MAAAVTVIGIGIGVPAAAEPGYLASRQTVALTPAPARPAAAAAAEPLAVTIDTLNPSVIPESGNVTITGTVTNTTTETWLGVNLYPLASDSLSMTSVAELDAAAQALPEQVIGYAGWQRCRTNARGCRSTDSVRCWPSSGSVAPCSR